MRVKRFLHIALLLAMGTLAAMAQPQMTWLERSHDFGVFMEQDGKVTCHLRVVNTGTEPLIIVKAQAGCGCTGVDYPSAPISAGDTAMVSITYNPTDRPGQFSKEVLVFTNTVPKRTVLEITGNVIPTTATLDKQYPLQAGSLRISQQNIPLGEITRGENKTQFLSCYNASTDTLLVGVEGAQPHLVPAIVPDTVPPARVTALTVHYMSNKAPLWGLNADALTVTCRPMRTPSTATAGSATINVMAQVTESFEDLTEQQRQQAPIVSVDCGDRLDFGEVNIGEMATRTFTITNKGKSPLAIRRLWVPDDEGITISVDRNEVKRNKKATVTVTVDTSNLQGELLNVPLTLLCNDPDNPRMTIRLVGILNNRKPKTEN